MKQNLRIKVCLLIVSICAGFCSLAQTVSTLAGVGMGMFNAGFSGDGGPATLAQLNVPFDVVLKANSDLVFSDKLNNRIRMISANGIITTIAGTGTAGFSGDGGAATAAQITNPTALAIDASGAIYFTDNGTRIRRIDGTTGIITTFAGTGTAGYNGEGGAALATDFKSIEDIAVIADGTMYIADGPNRRVRKISASGIVTTVAGNGTAAFAGDNGPATSASLSYPISVLPDDAGNLYIADFSDKRIRMVNSSGIITTVAGDGSTNYASSGVATAIGLKNVTDLAMGPNGAIYFSESQSIGSNLRSLSSSFVSTVLSGGSFGGTGQGGPLAMASVNSLRGFAVDGSGNLYLSDPDDSRIVMICNTPGLPVDSARYIKSEIVDNAANPFTAIERCNTICKFGSTTQTGEMHYQVRVNPTEPTYSNQPFVKRHYDLGVLMATVTGGIVTLYFTQAEFDSYNVAAATNYTHLPVSSTDNAGINNMVLMQYGGTGTAPGNYTGTTETITITPADITYNLLYSRWEISFSTTELGAYYITSKPQELGIALELANAQDALMVYPTITNSIIHIKAHNSATGSRVSLLDATGRTMLSTELLNGEQILDLGPYPTGVYTLRDQKGRTYRVVRY